MTSELSPQLFSQLQEENQRLRRAVEELSILNDLARAIGASVNTQEIIETITRKSLRALHAEQSVVTMIQQDSSDMTKTLVRENLSSTEQEKFHLHQSMLGWMMLNKKPLMINDPRHDERFRGVQWDDTVRSLLCVPLVIKSALKGVITVYNKKEGKPFTEEDQRLLVIIAAQSAQVIENARLYEQEKSLLAMQEQIRLAAQIQQELLPKKIPELPGYEIYATSISAQQVGGDYYDFISINDHRLAVCIGDVTGKGLPAALLMANVQATLRGQAISSQSPSECLSRSNHLLFLSTSSEKFCTLFYGILDVQHHEFHFCNAGHDHPFLCSDSGVVKRLSTGGLMLGIFDNVPFEQEIVQIQQGDVIFAYSDGITEAVNVAQEQFSETRVAEILQQYHNESANVIAERMIDAVRTHANGYPQSDDLTMLIVKRTL
jgi:sigma-B regulation protein RsbU (phosphoserine phosphatase)